MEPRVLLGTQTQPHGAMFCVSNASHAGDSSLHEGAVPNEIARDFPAGASGGISAPAPPFSDAVLAPEQPGTLRNQTLRAACPPGISYIAAKIIRRDSRRVKTSAAPAAPAWRNKISTGDQPR